MRPITVREVVLGVVLPLSALAALLFLGRTTDVGVLFLVAIAAVPLVSALLAQPALVAVVSIASVLAASVTAAGVYPNHFIDGVPLVFLTIVTAGFAVIISRLRVTRPTAPGGSGASGPVDPNADAVTGLPIRATVEAALTSTPNNDDRIVAVIDPDHLASLNDQHGRAVGDEFLFAIGGRTAYALRERDGATSADVIARWDDDELVFVFTPHDSSTELLELITDKVNKNRIRTDSGLVEATMSVGAVTWAAGQPFDDAVARAHAAVASAKSEGGARLVIQ